MDPNATLARLRELIPLARAAMDPDEGSNDAEHEILWEITELINALDSWLSYGGFLPRDWTNTAGRRFSAAELDRPQS